MGLERIRPAPNKIKAAPPNMYKVSLSVPELLLSSWFSMDGSLLSLNIVFRVSNRFFPVQNSGNQRLDQFHRIIQHRLDRITQAHLAFFRAQGCGLAADKQDPL